MIEKFFLRGVRFRWACPPKVQLAAPHGGIKDSTVATAPMVYIGLEADVDPRLMAVHTSTIGFQMNQPIPHRWLEYAEGKTSRLAMGGFDVLTGKMSGCYIARNTSGGATHAMHVGTIDTNPGVNTAVKQGAAAVLSNTSSGFSPADAWHYSELLPLQALYSGMTAVFALVTTTGKFFSIAMTEPVPGEWVCLGCKPCVAVPGIALRARLKL